MRKLLPDSVLLNFCHASDLWKFNTHSDTGTKPHDVFNVIKLSYRIYIYIYKNLSAIRRGFIFLIFPSFYRFSTPSDRPTPSPNAIPFSRFDFHFCWRSTPLHNYLFLKEHEFSKNVGFLLLFLAFFSLLVFLYSQRSACFFCFWCINQRFTFISSPSLGLYFVVAS